MTNMDSLQQFMRYFEPHCLERDGQRVCYVSALEYPLENDALDALGEEGLLQEPPQKISLKYAQWSEVDQKERWILHPSERSGAYPVWVITV
ncbi:MAG: hypothetical protein RBR42_04725 [Desulfomicrobium sp.]|nr:hypothetical protein [Desulfomicrobium sp.]NLV96983.1 hypothetical protein [Desulfovibrionales bacterium]